MARDDVVVKHRRDLRNQHKMFGALTFIGLAAAMVAALAMPQLGEGRKLPGLTFVASRPC